MIQRAKKVVFGHFLDFDLLDRLDIGQWWLAIRVDQMSVVQLTWKSFENSEQVENVEEPYNFKQLKKDWRMETDKFEQVRNFEQVKNFQ